MCSHEHTNTHTNFFFNLKSVFLKRLQIFSLEVSTGSAWSLSLHVAKPFCSLSGQDMGLTWKLSTIVMVADDNRDGRKMVPVSTTERTAKGKGGPSKTRAQVC